MVIKQQSGYTKVLTATIARQDLSTVVSGTGQIKPKTYVNLGATAMGRITHLYVKEGDMVKKGRPSPPLNMSSRKPPSWPAGRHRRRQNRYCRRCRRREDR